MPRFRIEFSKGDEVRFLSHLDIMKAFERAIRRASIPIAFSEGFNPHPRMNFASALAVGVVSDREYLDMELKHEVDLKHIVGALSRAVPPGLRIREGKAIPREMPSLMAVVNRAVYKVTAPLKGKVQPDELAEAVADFMASSEVMITKRTKKGLREKNIRPGIIGLQARTEGDNVDFFITAVTGNEGNVRPEEVVCAFAERSGLPIDADSLYIKRTGLFIAKDGDLISPMDVQ